MLAESSTLELAPVENDVADKLEAAMLKHPEVFQTKFAEDADIRHFFAPGLYVRSLFRKAGTYVVGHAHRHADAAILLHGRLRVLVDGKVQEIVGPSKPFLTEAGTRKLTVAIEDSTLMTFHPTDLTDLEEIEAEIFIKSPAFLDYESQRRLVDPSWNTPKKEIT